MSGQQFIILIVNFNSTMGWLWVRGLMSCYYLIRISIPLWDDCELTFGYYNEEGRLISIPLWDDCEKRVTYLTLGWHFISIPLWDDCEKLRPNFQEAQCSFQFHYGMIVSDGKGAYTVGAKYFNSTMGWLWVIANGCNGLQFTFQFHYGMIVRAMEVIPSAPDTYFNSTMGWLWVPYANINLTFHDISIPLWDDCESFFKEVPLVRVLFQFHYGMIVSTLLWAISRYLLKFQFHYGMIVR